MLINVKDHVGKLVRDSESGAILNIDKTAIIKQQMHEASLKKERDLQNKINTLETEVSSIKSTLDKILELLSSNRGS